MRVRIVPTAGTVAMKAVGDRAARVVETEGGAVVVELHDGSHVAVRVEGAKATGMVPVRRVVEYLDEAGKAYTAEQMADWHFRQAEIGRDRADVVANPIQRERMAGHAALHDVAGMAWVDAAKSGATDGALDASHAALMARGVDLAGALKACGDGAGGWPGTPDDLDEAPVVPAEARR